MPALPLTAIGKVYKPALRAQAAQRVLQQRLAGLGLAQAVTVRGEDQADKLVLCFGAKQPEAVRAHVQACMAGFALAWELAQAS